MENVASRFGQRLAHTEKKYRDAALKKLSLYLSKRAQWSELEWDKLWKALFYCMWMSDKRAIQDELSTNLAALVHRIPSPDAVLGFVHSFFRTMHREWHGIDGLRLDKFYALMRKFVHQSLLLLAAHDWDTALVQQFVSIVSSEVMSQLPNGLRLHVTDLFLVELHAAAGESVDSDTFVLLLEPFFTLLSSEYDKTVFKRVRELVFLPMLTTYVFGAPEKKKKKTNKKNKKTQDENETDAEDQEEEEEEEKRFPHVELARVQHRIFAIASADDTAERNRSVLYEMYGQFFKTTKVDSLKAVVAEPVAKVSTKRKHSEVEKEEKPVEAASAEGEAKKKRKRRKKSKAGEEQEDVKMDETAPVEVEAVETKKKKKTSDETPVVAEPARTVEADEGKKKKKEKRTKEETAPVKKEDKKTKAEEPVVDATPAKKEKKSKTEPVAEPSPKKEKKTKSEPVAELPKKEKKTKLEPVTEPAKKEKKTKTETVAEPVKQEKKENDTVTRSGMKFRRCAGCGGIGKGLVPVGKSTCRHCERTGAVKKKEAKEAKKQAAKRKADAIATEEPEAETPASKKVTFGKNRALAHELSVKRLKASAKEPATKELTDEHKGVLRVKAQPPSSSSTKSKGGKRMKAADFF